MKNHIFKAVTATVLFTALLIGMATTALAADYSSSEWGPLPASGSITFSGTGESQPADTVGDAPAVMLPTAEEFTRAYLDRINHHRQQHDLAALKLDPQLCEVAQARMSGGDWDSVLADYSGILEVSIENTASFSADPAGLADGFYHSDSHRATLLDEEAGYIGIALQYVDNGTAQGYALRQVFARDK